MTIGERIKKRRKELKIPVDTLADKLGKNRATIYRYENDEIENLPLTILEPLADTLQTTPGYLMGWDEMDEELNKIKHDLDIFDAKVSFHSIFNQIIKSFGYEVEENFATDLDGDTTILFENNSEAFEIKEKLFNELLNSCFSYIDFGINKLISNENRVKSNFFVESFEKEGR